MLHRTRTWAHFALILIVVLLSTSIVFAQDTKPAAVGLRPDAPTYALHGPYWVGTMAMDAKTDLHPTIVQIWYPAKNAAGKPETITYQGGPGGQMPFLGHAILGAEVDSAGGPYPLVIFVHGLGGGTLSSLYLCEHLASQGFVVIAIDYADSGDLPTQTDPALSLFTRPKDVSWQIDYMGQLNTDNSSKLQGVIDLEHIAVVGHSFGGYTTLVAAGAQMDLTGSTSWCLKEPNKDLPAEIGGGTLQERFCNHAQDIAKLAGLKAVPDGLWPSWGDPRIDMLVSLAPWMPYFGADSTKSVTIPSMLMYGTKDRIVWTEDALYQPYAYDNLSSKAKSLVLFDQADHSVFGTDCSSASWLADVGYFWACSDPVWEMNRAHDLINHFTTAFLLDVLKGDKEAHKALLPDAVNFAGIDYKTTLK